MTNEEKVLFELDVDRRIRAGVPAHHAHQAAQAQHEQNRRLLGLPAPSAPPFDPLHDFLDRLNVLHDRHAALCEEVAQLRQQLHAIAQPHPSETKKAKR